MVPDGATVAIGGLSTNCTPMALVRELARQGRPDARPRSSTAWPSTGWWRPAASAASSRGWWVSRLRAGPELPARGPVRHGRVSRSTASSCWWPGCRQPLATCRSCRQGGLGTDVLDLHPETTRLEHDRATGEPYVAATPLPIDVAIVHAQRPITRKHTGRPPAGLDGRGVVNAAATTIVTVEVVAAPRSSSRAGAHDLAPVPRGCGRGGPRGGPTPPRASRCTPTTPRSSRPTGQPRDPDSFHSFFEERGGHPPPSSWPPTAAPRPCSNSREEAHM